MMTFSFTFEDYEEAEMSFTAFSATCRQLKEALANRPKKPSKAAPLEKTPLETAIDEAGEEQSAEPPKAKRGRPRKTDKVDHQAPLDGIPPKETVAVRPATTVEELKTFVTSNRHVEDAAMKLTRVLKKHGVKRVGEVKPENVAAVYRDLRAEYLGDEIPF